jgi:hypothetical protein
MAEGSCPALRSLTICIEENAAWLACRPSLIRASVQALRVTFSGWSDQPLALAGALSILDYRGSLVMDYVSEQGGQREHWRAILEPRLSALKFECP